MYVTGRRNRFRLHKVHLFLIRIPIRVDLSLSVFPFVRMNAYISETIKDRLLDSWASFAPQVFFCKVPRPL